MDQRFPRLCSHSQQRSKVARERSEGQIVPCELVVASGDTTKMFDAIEKALDDVSGSVQHTAIVTPGLSIRARWNNGVRMCSAEGVYKGVRVITFVGDHRARAQMLGLFVRTRNVRDLSSRDNHSQRPPSSIDS